MHFSSRGFSLIEMLVALAILAAVTSVALRSMNNLQSQARYQQTTRTLDDIRSAIVGPPNLRAADGTQLTTGFVADTGRLPNHTISISDPLGPNGDPLNELLQRNALPAFQFWASNTDPLVLVGAGWKGPYLQLPSGPAFIRDGWGNSFRVYDSGGTPATAGNPLAQIASWGADNLADTNHGGGGDTAGYNADVSIPNALNFTSGGFQSSATLYGSVSMALGTDTGGTTSGPAPNLTYTPAGGGGPFNVAIWVCYYGPDLTASPRPVVDISTLTPITSATGWQYTLSNSKIAPGPRVLKAYVMDTAFVTDATAFRTYVANAPNTATGPVFFATSLNVSVTGGSQTAPNLVLPHYAP